MINKLYSYQKEIVKIVNNNLLGQIILPTGTGKTYCQASILSTKIQTNPTFNIYVVNAPRILLTYQLLKEIYTFLTKSNIESRYMFVHSGNMIDESELEEIRVNTDIKYSQIISTTNVSDIINMMNNSKELNLPLIIFSTYNSSDRIETARLLFNEENNTEYNIELVLNDEAHYLVQEQFHSILNKLTYNNCFFFTATSLHTSSNNGRGMNNLNVYGEVLYEMTPKQAIELGKMIRPRLHFVNSSKQYNSNDYRKSISNIIYESFLQHQQVLYNSKNKIIEPKLLISVKGTQDIKQFINSLEYLELIKNNVHIFAIASNTEIGNNINNIQYSRTSFLSKLKEYGNDDSYKLIVLHYDIISEGLDISGFTGIMPFRGLSKSKFMQTLGRSTRLHPIDRRKLELKELESEQLDNFIKPFSYVIIPNIINDNNDDKETIIQIIRELRSNNFKLYDTIISSSIINGIPEIELLDNLNELQKRIPLIGDLINELESDIELVEDTKLEKIEFLSKVIDSIIYT